MDGSPINGCVIHRSLTSQVGGHGKIPGTAEVVGDTTSQGNELRISLPHLLIVGRDDSIQHGVIVVDLRGHGEG